MKVKIEKSLKIKLSNDDSNQFKNVLDKIIICENKIGFSNFGFTKEELDCIKKLKNKIN